MDPLLTQPPEVETGPIQGETRFIMDSNYLYTLNDASTGSSYSWSVEGGEIWTGQGSSSVEVEWRSTGQGLVKVAETDVNGCTGDTVYLQTALRTPAGIQSPHSQVSLYPNPTHGILQIRGLENREGFVEIYSLLGQLVLRRELSPALNLKDLSRGTYTLRVVDRRAQPLFTRKIVLK